MNKLKFYLQLARLNKPIGSLLLLWPTLWALWLANHGLPNVTLLSIFIVGTFVTRSAGCVINDILDRKFDPYVARTSSRPLAAGNLSLKQALGFLAILACIALILLLQLNLLAISIGLFAAIITCTYPLMKRVTHFPQIVIGIAFGMGIPMAYAASINHLPFPCWLMFSIQILWGLMYDSAYAITDYPDDIKIGVKSTAVFFKKYTRLFIAILQCLVVLGFILLGYVEQLKISFYFAVLASGLLFAYQQILLKNNKAFNAFLNNQWVGLLIWLGILLGV